MIFKLDRHAEAARPLLAKLAAAQPWATRLDLEKLIVAYIDRGTLPACAFEVPGVLDALVGFAFRVRPRTLRLAA